MLEQAPSDKIEWKKTFERNMKYKRACVFCVLWQYPSEEIQHTTTNNNEEIQTKQKRNTNEIQTYTKKEKEPAVCIKGLAPPDKRQNIWNFEISPIENVFEDVLLNVMAIIYHQRKYQTKETQNTTKDKLQTQ